jgi:signal transduction histidine kinase/ligand-binding sensor domain-containing protein
LNAFSTFLSGTRLRQWSVVALLATAATPLLATPAAALDPDRALTQYLRDAWGREQGFPGGPVYGLTQTADGYLWIAAEKGLVRFDGIRFRLFEPSGSTSATGPTVLGVAAAPDGSLWARLRGPALVRFRDGAFENILPTVGLPGSIVTAMLRGRDNAMLLATVGEGAISYRSGTTARVIAPRNVLPPSFIISLAEMPDGEIWFGTRDAGLLRVEGSRVSRITEGLRNPKINCLLAGDEGELWIGTDRGVTRWKAGEITGAGVPNALGTVPAMAMIRDRDSNLWIAAGPSGLLRVNSRGVTMLTTRDRPFAGSVTAVFEDRDRNLWVGTTTGIERLRDGVFTTHSTVQGLPSGGVGAIHVDAAQRIWIAPTGGGLYLLHDGTIERIRAAALNDDVVYSITGAGTEVWVGRQRGGLTRLRPTAGQSFTADNFTQADGLAQNSVYAVHQTRDGALWAGTLSGGASRFHKGVFTTFGSSQGLASNTVSSILESADGTLWFGTPNGISTLSQGAWRRYATGNGLPSNDINILFEDSTGTVWAGTADGAAIFGGAGFHSPANLPSGLRGSILGFAEDKTGALWVETADRVFRVRRRGGDVKASPDYDAREYGIADGLLTLEGVKRHRSLVADARGRIWLARTGGLAMTDPARGDASAMPALPHVEALSADGTAIDLLGPRQVLARRRRITIAYAGLSLAVPERVMFQYRLDGFDTDWSRPVAEREAVYTNLNPGPYVFRVKASNGDGLWTSTEASVRFDVEPSVWQTAWFQISAVTVGALGGWGLFRLRVFHVSRKLHRRFEAQLAERTRIAQELHDTLLQGFISASMQLHVAADRLPADSLVRPSIVRVLELMGRVIEEGRVAVRGLRSSRGAAHDLEEAFAGVREELAEAGHIEYRVTIEGEVRPLHPMVRDEVYRIGREALVNAFRHARAGIVELELDYAPNRLRLHVRDDGRGIDPEVASSGTDGHWGLAGMRERAEKIGAQFTIRSRQGAGTEIELTVPAKVAFDRQPTDRDGSWIARLLRKSRKAGRQDGTKNV